MEGIQNKLKVLLMSNSLCLIQQKAAMVEEMLFMF